MCARYSRALQGGVIGVLCLFSSIALADTAEEYARAQQFIADESMMDGLVIMRKLAVQNYAPAQRAIGEFLDEAEDDDEAVGWFMMAANQGDSDGERCLGIMYLKGEGVKKDPEKALYWIKRAFEKDNMSAVKVMESAYRWGPEKSGLPVAVDLALADSLKAKIKAHYEASLKADEAKIEARVKAKKAAEAKKAEGVTK